MGGAGTGVTAHFLKVEPALSVNRTSEEEFVEHRSVVRSFKLAGRRDVLLLLSLCVFLGLGAGVCGQEPLEFNSSYEFSVRQGAPKTIGYQLVESQQV